MPATLDEQRERPVDLTGSTGRSFSPALEAGEEGASPTGCGLGPALQPTHGGEPASDDDLALSLFLDGALAPVGHSLEVERFIEQQHGDFS
jgi:hypothetical protein